MAKTKQFKDLEPGDEIVWHGAKGNLATVRTVLNGTVWFKAVNEADEDRVFELTWAPDSPINLHEPEAFDVNDFVSVEDHALVVWDVDGNQYHVPLASPRMAEATATVIRDALMTWPGFKA